MENKDWIVLLVPIVCNGVLISVFQRILSKKIERQTKRQDIRDEVVKTFWNKLQGLNDTFIQWNIAALQDPEVAGNCILTFWKIISEIIQYYDTNEFDLKIFDKEYTDFINQWDNFKNIYEKYMGKQLNFEMKKQLGEALQRVKEKNQELIKTIREKY